MLVELLNGLVNVLYIIAYGLTFLLPVTPFSFEVIEWGEFGKALGLIFPIESMLKHFAVLLSAILIYYAIRWILRMIRQIQ